MLKMRIRRLWDAPTKGWTLCALVGLLALRPAMGAPVTVEWSNWDDHIYDSSGADQRTNSWHFQLVLDPGGNTQVGTMVASNYWYIRGEGSGTAIYGADEDVTVPEQNTNWLFNANWGLGYVDGFSQFEGTNYGNTKFYFRFFNAGTTNAATGRGLIYNLAGKWRTVADSDPAQIEQETAYLGRLGLEAGDLAGSVHPNRTDGWATMPDRPVPTPLLSRSPVSLTASCPQGQNAAEQSFKVWNGGGGTLSYTIESSNAWLTVSPTAGSSTGPTNTHTVTYGSVGLATGSYSGTLMITAPGATNSPQTVAVTLTVLPTTGERLIVDNAHGLPWVTPVGAWTASAYWTGYYASNYWHDGNAGKGTKSVTYRPSLLEAGAYTVSLWYTEAASYATNVPVDVIHAGGTNTIYVNQRINGKQWYPLGMYSFAAGTSAQVRIRTTDTGSGYVEADAVRFAKVSEKLIVDNADGLPWVTPVGAWAASAYWTGYYASNYWHDGNVGKGTKSVTYRPSLLEAGAYTVSLWYTEAASYATNVPVDVIHAGGTNTIYVNQRINGKQWYPLGMYSFAAGTSAQVRIRTTDTGSGYVEADAVRFAKVSEKLIVDNADGLPWVTPVGAWAASAYWTGYYASNYWHDGNVGKGTKSVTYRPSLLEAGTYTVSLWYTEAASYATNVPVDVIHAGGTNTIYVNQRINGKQWYPLGTYSFAAGTSAQVRIRTTDTGSGYVEADAVRFATASDLPIVVIDDADAAPMMTFTGSWSASTSVPGYYGAGYRHDNNAVKGTKNATFRPTLPEAGAYQVYARYAGNQNYATNVPVDIVHAAGMATVTVNQRLNANVWNLLGAWTFDAGAGGYVRIRTTGTTNYVMADAVKFVKLPDLPIVSVTASDATAGEPGSGQGAGAFTFTRTGSTTAALTVHFTVGGTAAAGGDYTALGTSVTFTAGSAMATATVSVIDDTLVEGDETVVLTLAGGPDYLAGSPSETTVTIKDDEAPAFEVVIDDADVAPMMTFTGVWLASTSVPGYYGAGYRHDNNAVKGTKSATFRPTLPETGTYEVYARYAGNQNYATNVPVDIVHAAGMATVTVNQRLNTNVWNLLGAWTFDAGAAGYVRIRTAGTTNYVMADAVKFVKAGSPAPGIQGGMDLELRNEGNRDRSVPEFLSSRLSLPENGVGVAWPRVWAGGDPLEQSLIANLTDGDTNTLWMGSPGGAPWWIGLDFGRVNALTDFAMLFLGAAWTNTGVVGSPDGLVWFDVLNATNPALDCRYLMIQMVEDPSRPEPPAVREIEWEEAE